MQLGNTTNVGPSEYELARHQARAGVQSVDIALRILRVLVSANKPLTLKEFSARCGMSPSKLHRYLHSYVAAGMVMQTRAGEYDLGNLALEVGHAAIQRIDLVNHTAGRLFELVIDTGMPGILAVWSPQGPTIVRWQMSPLAINSAFSIGSLLPLLSSPTGHVFLAYLPMNVTAPVVAKEITASTSEATRIIEETIKPVRQQGYAISNGVFVPGLTGISAPVLNQQNESLAVVTVLTRTDQADTAQQGLIGKVLAFTASCSLHSP